jgi:hypothetical protein
MMPEYPRAETATARAVMVLRISYQKLLVCKNTDAGVEGISLPRHRRQSPEDVHDGWLVVVFGRAYGGGVLRSCSCSLERGRN